MRKGQGAYYTPREIVHYMCQESLINHLNTETRIDAERIRKLIAFKDEDLVNGNGSRKKSLGFSDDEAQSLDRALSNIKVCDPACGSGAFLVGMLNEIVSARRILEPRSEYKLKKETIQECIYGVDIDPGAVDIAKLRLWLSLVVDFELRDIEPLPNLDYKIMCGNSLLEELIVGNESIKLFDERLLNLKELKSNPPENTRKEALKSQLQEKQKELFDLNAKNKLSMAKKKELDAEIAAINKELNPKAKKTKIGVYHPVFFADQADEYFKRLRELHKQFFTEYDPIKKKERRKQIEEIELEFIKSSIKEKVDEFDSKIKNLNMQDPGDRKRQAVLMQKKLEYLAIPGQIRNSKTRPYFLWKLNFFEVFQEKGGFDVVIANPPYVRVDEIDAQEREKFKSSFITATGKYDLYYLFFEKALSISGLISSCVFISPNKFCAADSAKKLRDLFFNIITSGDILSTSRLKVFDSVSNYPVISILKKGKCIKSDFIVKQAQDINSLMTVDKSSGYISSIEKLRAFPDSIIPININQESFDLIQRLFVNSVPLSSFLSISEGLRIPVKYESESKQDFEIVKQYQFSKWSEISTGAFISNSNLLKVISKDADRYKKILQEKILIAEDALEINATIDRQKRIPQGGVYFAICLKDNLGLEYLIGLLNSKLFSWMYKVMYSGMHMGGGYLRYRSRFLENLSLPRSLVTLSTNDQRFIIEKVEEILIIFKSYKDQESQGNIPKIKEYERQIDQMVCKLYGLSQEEIDIIEKL
ncbi:MAG: Eco57I restriction-modification methylase domain-containing protein [Candidatus Omnitrophica bacterium]|nr:Eco57I restriction-modification methylase domain-containing protein [Candidatus Omnitrophota bacterium]